MHVAICCASFHVHGLADLAVCSMTQPHMHLQTCGEIHRLPAVVFTKMHHYHRVNPLVNQHS